MGARAAGFMDVHIPLRSGLRFIGGFEGTVHHAPDASCMDVGLCIRMYVWVDYLCMYACMYVWMC